MTSAPVAQWPSVMQMEGSGHSESERQARQACVSQIGFFLLTEQSSSLRHPTQTPASGSHTPKAPSKPPSAH